MTISYSFNPFTGNLDVEKGAAVPSIVDAAKILVDSGFAGENISALQLVYLSDPNTFMIADNDTYSTAVCAGIALNAANTGSAIDVQLFGRHEDPFWGFTLNEPLFLSDITPGSVIQTEPTNNNLVRIGSSLGSGAIFIDIEDPVIL